MILDYCSLKALHDDRGQSMRNISRTLKVSSSTVAKTIKLYEETGSHENRHRKGRSRDTSDAEEEFTSLRNCSPNKCFTEFT
jgi:transposase